MVFTGTYDHAIDAKNRLAIPSEIRAQLQREAAVRRSGDGEGGDNDARPVALYVTLGERGALCLYTEQGFEQRAAELDRSELDADQLLAYERVLFSLAQRVEMDSAGRIRLPEQLLKRTGLAGEVVLLGVKDHMEIRDRAAWHDYVESLLQSQPQMLMNPRKAMKKAPSTV